MREDNAEDLHKRLDRVASEMLSVPESASRGAILLTLLEAEGIRVKLKKRKKRS